MKPLVVIESPFRGYSVEEAEAHLAYARECLLDSIQRGECPVASHLLYTQALNDEIPAEREAGLVLAAELVKRADAVAFYVDRGLSPGMYRTLRELYPRNGLPDYVPGMRLEAEDRTNNDFREISGYVVLRPPLRPPYVLRHFTVRPIYVRSLGRA